MMTSMPRPRPPHLSREVTRHGRLSGTRGAMASAYGCEPSLERRSLMPSIKRR